MEYKESVHDDLAGAKQPFKVIACLAVRGRLPLLKHTIERLYKKNGVFRVICAGDNHYDRKVVEAAGAEWVQIPNRPLGRKWNESFRAAEKYNPDACLFVGSSDWLSDNWLEELEPEARKYDLIGTPGCNFLHIGKEFIACHWPGYVGARKDESIGIGRLISRQVLTCLQWKPFSDHLDSSLDRSMNERVRQAVGSIQLIDNLKIKSCSISTDEWINKHKFNDCFNGVLPSEIIPNVEEWIDQNFPEAKLVFNAGVHQ
jgi:hypothetical protein